MAQMLEAFRRAVFVEERRQVFRRVEVAEGVGEGAAREGDQREDIGGRGGAKNHLRSA